MMGVGAIIAAITGAEMVGSNNTDMHYAAPGDKPQRNGDIFNGDFFTDPDEAWAVGDNYTTEGEKMDADIKNHDWGKVTSNIPAAAQYWADPAGSMTSDFGSSYLGNTAGWVVDPVYKSMQWIGDKF